MAIINQRPKHLLQWSDFRPFFCFCKGWRYPFGDDLFHRRLRALKWAAKLSSADSKPYPSSFSQNRFYGGEPDPLWIWISARSLYSVAALHGEKVLHWKSKREFLFCGGYQWKQPAAYGLLFYIILFQQNYRLDRTVERNLFSTAGRRAFWGTIGTPSWKNRFYPQHLFNRGGSDNKKIFSNDNRQWHCCLRNTLTFKR